MQTPNRPCEGMLNDGVQPHVAHTFLARTCGDAAGEQPADGSALQQSYDELSRREQVFITTKPQTSVRKPSPPFAPLTSVSTRHGMLRADHCNMWLMSAALRDLCAASAAAGAVTPRTRTPAHICRSMFGSQSRLRQRPRLPNCTFLPAIHQASLVLCDHHPHPTEMRLFVRALFGCAGHESQQATILL